MRLGWLTRDKHLSLFQKILNYREKSFITLGPKGVLQKTENIKNMNTSFDQKSFDQQTFG